MKRIAVRIAAAVVAIVAGVFGLMSCSDAVRSAIVREAEGEVLVARKVSKEDIAAFVGMKLDGGDRIRTGENSKAVLDLDSDKRAILASNTDIAVLELSAADSDTVTVFYLEKGGIGNKVDSKLGPKSKYEIKTPTAALGIRGTEFYVQAEDGEVQVWLAKGTISMQYVTENGLLTEYGREGGAMNVIVLEAPAKFSFPVVGEKVDETPKPFDADGLYKEFLDSPAIQELIEAQRSEDESDESPTGTQANDTGGSSGEGDSADGPDPDDYIDESGGPDDFSKRWAGLSPVEKSDAEVSIAASHITLEDNPSDALFDRLMVYNFVNDYDTIAFYNERGERITELFPAIDVPFLNDLMYEGGMFAVKNESGEYACYNNLGELVIPFGLYDEPLFFKEGIATYNRKNSDGSLSGQLIDRKGRIVATLQRGYFAPGVHSDIEAEFRAQTHEEGYIFSHDRIRIFTYEGKVGAVDLKGEEVIPPQFDNLYLFREGLAAFKQGEKYGFVDEEGKVVIPATFQYVGTFDNGVARVSEDAVLRETPSWPYVAVDGTFYYIDYQGNPVAAGDPRISGASVFSGVDYPKSSPVRDNRFAEAESALYLYRSGGLYGYVNAAGEAVIPAQYPYAAHFSDGLACVQPIANGQFGFINRMGEMVIEPRFDHCYAFENDLAVVGVRHPEAGPYELRHLYGVIDRNGNEVLPLRYEVAAVEPLRNVMVTDRERALAFLEENPGGLNYIIMTYDGEKRERHLVHLQVEPKND